jgi:hypothetical protein
MGAGSALFLSMTTLAVGGLWVMRTILENRRLALVEHH